jgi:hypothetical protein
LHSIPGGEGPPHRYPNTAASYVQSSAAGNTTLGHYPLRLSLDARPVIPLDLMGSPAIEPTDDGRGRVIVATSRPTPRPLQINPAAVRRDGASGLRRAGRGLPCERVIQRESLKEDPCRGNRQSQTNDVCGQVLVEVAHHSHIDRRSRWVACGTNEATEFIEVTGDNVPITATTRDSHVRIASRLQDDSVGCFAVKRA